MIRRIVTILMMVVGALVLMSGAMAVKVNFIPGMFAFCVGGVVACAGFIFYE